MRYGMILRGLVTAVLLTGLIIFSAACRSAPEPRTAEILSLLEPPVPEAPEAEEVKFEGRDGGLWLSYEDYRALERNVIALREYAGKLEIVIGFYRGE